jgi:NAD(P)-dependent dehydrogenase (short-subunit alcohol dehydrogenase family)
VIGIDLSGKSVLVTGGGAGIGLACAEMFREAGARVIIAEIDKERCAAFGEDAIECDVTLPEGVAHLRSELDLRTDRLDVLVNNVGHFLHIKPFEAMAGEEIDAVVGVNLTSLLKVTHAMLPLLRAAAPGSSIVNITSVEGFRALPNCAIYAASKAAIAGFTKSFALELGPDGIRINDVAPELTDTPQTPLSTMIPPENQQHIGLWNPLGRYGVPRDIAGAVLFLASDLASWITGTTLHVDGGALAAAGWTRDANGTWTIMPIASGNGMGL